MDECQKKLLKLRENAQGHVKAAWKGTLFHSFLKWKIRAQLVAKSSCFSTVGFFPGYLLFSSKLSRILWEF